MTEMELREEIRRYEPFNEQEREDKKEILRQMEQADHILTRDNRNAHITVSAWIMDESGLESVRFVTEDIFSLEILTVDGHEKRGSYVPSHLHLNVTYLLEADPELSLRIKEDENSEIGWIGVEEIQRRSTEKWFVERIYSKLCKKAQSLRNGKLAIPE